MRYLQHDDKQYIKQAADKLAECGKTLNRPNRVVIPICQYAFNTPMEFQQQISTVWKKIDKSEMEGFLPSITAAVFKNRDKEDMDIELSPFNYEF